MEIIMKFITNTHNPKDVERAKMSLALSFEDMYDREGRERAWQRHLDYLSDKFISRPQATTTYTVEELEAMGMVGVYKIEDYTISGKEAKDVLQSILDMDKL